jgi:hypothetical protein
MGPGRPAVIVDEVWQRLFNKHFDEGYSADDIWKQNSDFHQQADRVSSGQRFPNETGLTLLATCYARTE